MVRPGGKRIQGFESAGWPMSLNAAAYYLLRTRMDYKAIIRRVLGFNPGTRLKLLVLALNGSTALVGRDPAYLELEHTVAVEAQLAIVDAWLRRVSRAETCQSDMTVQPVDAGTPSASEIQKLAAPVPDDRQHILACLKPLWRSSQTWRHFSKIRPSKLPSSAL
ncbi:hypothetical protein BBK36DRAFT_1200035 [Trichoderma citrinoviride]|uniref:Uncharacterized protein n=1 Tax=Trichoderma citrinoviride TaxID=58853 RepID=A0A2T4AX22_9HYPO|nr:hypothetical protein BBK36DRAFT_1200035 [Trichoderma citrinoviride]PTB61616.1 hypothetical protein BBK36DRAFT_1200035 [Trichoderma citrinoviride]